MATPTILFGPPGTGKTTRILDMIDGFLEEGYDPTRIALMAFTKKAASEAIARAHDRFNLTEDDLPHFRTLHSAGYRAAKFSRGEVMTEAHWKEFGLLLGYDFSEAEEGTDMPVANDRTAGKCLFAYGTAKAKGITLREAWERIGEEQLPFVLVQEFCEALEAYKRVHRVKDFTDMLEINPEPINTDVFIIDEAQDLSPTQWQLARRLAAASARVIIAGDDDQAIYAWSGADPNTLIHLRGHREVLPVSYRLPRRIKALADSVVSRITDRVPKEWGCRDAEGEVGSLEDMESVDLRHTPGTWLLLARHRHQLWELEKVARAQGVLYRMRGVSSTEHPTVRAVLFYERLRRGETVDAEGAQTIHRFVADMAPLPVREEYGWKDMPWPWGTERIDWLSGLTALPVEARNYIREFRRNGYSFGGTPTVTISTVHGIKGGEADNVLLLTDISRRVERGAREDPDAEWRVAYVGVTRARERLFVVRPRTRLFWDII